MLNVAYGFEGSFKPLGQLPFVSHVLTKENEAPATGRVNRFRDSWLGELPVPLPENYLLGIDQTKAEFEAGKRSYLHGRWKLGGWWYYYLYGLAVKVPLGTWGLFLFAIWMRVAAASPKSNVQCPKSEDGSAVSEAVTWREEVVLLAPAASVLVIVSSQAGSNALRYVLPAFPFVFVWISSIASFPGVRRFIAAFCCRGAAVFAAQRRLSLRERAFFRGAKDDIHVDKSPHFMIVGLATLVMLMWSILSSLSVYPHCLAYFNALGGGPLRGHAHLVGSNIDWGQD
ncbi:MAG: hypothetical protein ACREHD_18800, partial [Pirellulales bacterium]